MHHAPLDCGAQIVCSWTGYEQRTVRSEATAASWFCVVSIFQSIGNSCFVHRSVCRPLSKTNSHANTAACRAQAHNTSEKAFPAMSHQAAGGNGRSTTNLERPRTPTWPPCW